MGRKVRNGDGGGSCEERKELALDDQELKDTGQQGEDSGRQAGSKSPGPLKEFGFITDKN